MPVNKLGPKKKASTMKRSEEKQKKQSEKQAEKQREAHLDIQSEEKDGFNHSDITAEKTEKTEKAKQTNEISPDQTAPLRLKRKLTLPVVETDAYDTVTFREHQDAQAPMQHKGQRFNLPLVGSEGDRVERVLAERSGATAAERSTRTAVEPDNRIAAERSGATAAERSRSSSTGNNSRGATNGNDSSATGSRRSTTERNSRKNLRQDKPLNGDSVNSSGEKTRSQRADRSKNNKRKKAPLLLYFGIACFVVAAIIGGFLINRYFSAGSVYSSVFKASGIDLPIFGNKVPPDVEIEVLEGINWDALKEINPDIIGWIVIPDTRVNYPIVQTNNNDYYLNHLFDKTSNGAGAIFLDYLNDPAINGMNNFIYGHNLIDGSMFAGLKQYRDRAFFNDHKKVLLSTPSMNYELEVIACLVCDADDSIRRFSFSSRADFEGYVRMLLGYAVINDIPSGEIPDKIYCFVTCTDTNYAKRVIIIAKVVEEHVPPGANT